MSGPRGPYAADKVLHHRLHLEALRGGRAVAPLHVQLIPTNVCNQRCSFCAYRQHGYSSSEEFDCRHSVPWEKLAELVHDCERMGVRAVQVTGGGEPTCHPRFMHLCEEVLDAGIDLAVVTNGSRWTESHVDLLSAAKWVRFSVDAGTPETYAATRGVPAATYHRVRERVRMLCEKKLRPTVGVGFVVTRENWREIPAAVEAAASDGADNIRLSAVFQDEGARYFRGFGERAAAMCKEAQERSRDGFRVINLFGDRVNDLAQGRPDYRVCWVSRLTTYVGADLGVYRCCVYAYNKLGLLGSLADRPFAEMWADPRTQQELREFDARRCERCMFNEKNRAINRAVCDGESAGEPPEHVNFV